MCAYCKHSSPNTDTHAHKHMDKKANQTTNRRLNDKVKLDA